MRKGNSASAIASSTRFFKGLGNGAATSQRKIHKKLAPGSGKKVMHTAKPNARTLAYACPELSAADKKIARHIIDLINADSTKSALDIYAELSRHPKLIKLRPPHQNRGKRVKRVFGEGSIRRVYKVLRANEIISFTRTH
ncbi:MAG: hypothetical protein HOC95_03830 [Candidatus Diapherotrites archaeon]|jgi:hypothetical protein|nr:hypothetical protein [Candidatus Diapherotrites archaeon]